MKILDRYIIKQYLINFGILLLVIMLLFIVVDMIVDLDEFIQGGQRWAQHRLVVREAEAMAIDPRRLQDLVDDNAEARQVADALGIDEPSAAALLGRLQPGMLSVAVGIIYKIADFYGPLMILAYVFSSGLLVVAGTGFTFAALQRNRELTAILASGVSMYRVAAPVIVVGSVLSLVNLPLQEFVVPPLAQKLARDKSHVRYETVPGQPVLFAPDGQGNLLVASDFEPATEMLFGMDVLLRNEQGIGTGRIMATEAVWDEQQRGWRLAQGLLIAAQAVEGEQLGPTVREPQPIDFYPSDLTPKLLLARRRSIYPQLLAYDTLREMQTNPAVEPRLRYKFTQIIWSRWSMVVLNVLILVMGLPFFLQRGGTNMLIQGVKAAGVCVGAWAGGVVMLQAGATFLPPVAAAWFPVVIYMIVAALLLQTIKT